MKIIISEHQSEKLINNIINEQLNFTDFFKSKNSTDVTSMPDSEDVKNDGSTTFADNIPSDGDLMHPLGKKFKISSGFGLRDTGIRGASKNHKGIDISAPSGSPIYAPKDGNVDAARDTTPNGCGGFIKIKHDNLITKFCHVKQWVVNQGDKVKKGQLIGYSGGGPNDPHKGTSRGAHLHYEIRTLGDIAQNPLTVQSNLA